MPIIPAKALAEALKQAAKVAISGAAIRSADLERSQRELLLEQRFLRPVIRGWYLLTTPEAPDGSSVLWQGNFWPFVAAYLDDRFGARYCLSAESSLDLWGGKTAIPAQVLVMTESGGRGKVDYPSGRDKPVSSLLIYETPRLPAGELVEGVRVMPLGLALTRVTPTFFQLDPLTAEILLRRVSREQLTRALLAEPNLSAAGRLLGGLRHVGREDEAAALRGALQAVGFAVEESNPFQAAPRLSGVGEQSPYASRVVALWRQMRDTVAANAPKPRFLGISAEAYLAMVDEVYERDAYNSLSIEGYQVTEAMIRRIAQGAWDPTQPRDAQEMNAMAAKGYCETFKLVKASLRSTFEPGASPGQVFARDLELWHRALFSPAVQVGLLEMWELAGYRDRKVFIQNSQHVPPPKDAVPDCMNALFGLLTAEPDAWVRAVLGHFVFVFIHPYTDGNGRLGRFLMNLMLGSGGYGWTVVQNAHRDAYMTALETASVSGDIEPFCRMLAGEMRDTGASDLP